MKIIRLGSMLGSPLFRKLPYVVYEEMEGVVGIIVSSSQGLEVQGRVHNLTNAPRISVKVFLLVERPPSKTVRKAKRKSTSKNSRGNQPQQGPFQNDSSEQGPLTRLYVSLLSMSLLSFKRAHRSACHAGGVIR